MQELGIEWYCILFLPPHVCLSSFSSRNAKNREQQGGTGRQTGDLGMACHLHIERNEERGERRRMIWLHDKDAIREEPERCHADDRPNPSGPSLAFI